MKIVIDISGEIRKGIYDEVYCGISDERVYNAIKECTPLDTLISKVKELYKDSENGAADDETLGWDKALNKVIEILQEVKK